MNINIYIFRGQRVMLDEDLAKIYGVETRKLNQAIRRNKERFPLGFMFQLTKDEYANLRSQFVISNEDSRRSSLFTAENLMSQNVISKRGGRRKRPFVFTEHGAVMLASVLRSERAVKMSIEVVRAFINLRHTITSHENVDKQLSEIKSFMLKQSNKNDREFRKVWNAIEQMTRQCEDDTENQIGFRIDD